MEEAAGLEEKEREIEEERIVEEVEMKTKEEEEIEAEVVLCGILHLQINTISVGG